ncbi:MAG: phospho-sugar mutase, partial [Oscillospiraceae bacterium]|nr:phospho-sugar mutase [Oscillospiraceae bacterium]
LSFAVRELSCSSGIIITASHNPAKYNGYKCYDPNGYQMTDEAAEATYKYIQQTDIFDGVRTMSFESGLKSGIIEYISDEIIEKFYEKVLSVRINKGICESAKLRVIYTPLNGTGNIPVREILDRIGQKDVTVVPEQEYPDGNFPTCPYPNPEIREAFTLALENAEKNGADLLLATDPDCDRVGIAVLHDGEYRLMSGNEVGVLLTEYILSCRKANGTLPDRPVVIKSFVTTEMVARVAAKYGGETHSLLTGFKYIGELITKLEKNGEADRFTVGMEESYGYLSGIHARDKDAVVASMLITEMAAYYKNMGKTLVDVMNELYSEHGMYFNKLLNFSFEGASGMQKMRELMDSLRENSPKEIACMPVLCISDYKKSETVCVATGEKSKIDLPESNVLKFSLTNGNEVIVRPSGTEPKIKIYITSVETTREKASALADAIADSMKKIMNI